MIGLIDVDQTGFPNLALMKLSAWYKAHGEQTALLKPSDVLTGANLFQPYDKLYGACVFTRNAEIAKALQVQGVHVGGSGIGSKEVLPDEIEHMMPDYSLYGITDTAYGFLTRGCPRGCPFCIVANKEGRASRKVADLSEWWSGQKHIVLMDANILASRDRLDLLKQLADSKAMVDYSQGLDARLLDDDVITLINATRTKRLHFAWDNPRDTRTRDCLELASQKLRIKDASRRAVYVLTNYWSTLQEDLYRVYWLREHHFDPYVMIYDKEHAPRQIRRLQRWCNNRIIYGACKRFEDYEG